MATTIFVSYRRDDSAGWVGRLVDDLARRFGRENVFQDIESVAPGADFLETIEETLRRADCALVVIGPSWLTLAGPDGLPRLRREGDFVRREVAAALAGGLRVIPVLVGGARMPAAAELPEDLRGLARRNAAEVSDRRWDYDFAQLAEAIGRTARPGKGSARLASHRARGATPRRGLALVAAATALVGGGGAAWWQWGNPSSPPRPRPDEPEHRSADALRGAGGWRQRRQATGVADVAVGADGRVWLVHTDGTVSSSADGEAFSVVEAQGFARIAGARAGSAWAVGRNSTLWRYAGGQWTQIVGAPPAVDVDAEASGRVWLVGEDAAIWSAADGQTFRRDQRTSGFARIAVARRNVGVFGVGRNRTLWTLEGEGEGGWRQLRADGVLDAAVGPPNGRLWLLRVDGSAEFSDDGGRSFGTVPGAAFQSIAVGRQGGVWAVGLDGTLWFRPPER